MTSVVSLGVEEKICLTKYRTNEADCDRDIVRLLCIFEEEFLGTHLLHADASREDCLRWLEATLTIYNKRYPDKSVRLQLNISPDKN